tara:strand:+ start:27 stop:191 length:165 start_codon:yes stop_codon:yes gene_type:complete
MDKPNKDDLMEVLEMLEPYQEPLHHSKVDIFERWDGKFIITPKPGYRAEDRVFE